jgi:tryptophan synthase alpha chain
VVKEINRIKRVTDRPVCAGFGISSAQQVKDIGRAADGVIVGSAIVKAIAAHKGQRDLAGKIARYVRSLCAV